LAEIKERERTTVSGRPQLAEKNIVIRQCRTVEEFQACVALQKEVWRYSDADVIPVRLFVVASKIGGQIIGSFDGDVLMGFVLSIPGSRNGHSYLHSQMLAVRESYRNFGLGRRMKLAQREEALERGFKLMEWTFDPLEIKNAYLNIEKLGAIARRYSVNQYGRSSSPLQGGLPTDRLVAEWWLSSDRVNKLLQDGTKTSVMVEKTISVPAQIYAWKTSEVKRSQALNVQQANREQFLHAFSKGLAVLGYERDPEGNGAFLLGKPEEAFSF
jgi:predicted GNAT superfamily acetyltransferase